MRSTASRKRGVPRGALMRVAALELPAAWDHRERQLAAVDALLTFGPDAELVLLPEASLTGYVSPDGDFDRLRASGAEPRRVLR